MFYRVNFFFCSTLNMFWIRLHVTGFSSQFTKPGWVYQLCPDNLLALASQNILLDLRVWIEFGWSTKSRADPVRSNRFHHCIFFFNSTWNQCRSCFRSWIFQDNPESPSQAMFNNYGSYNLLALANQDILLNCPTYDKLVTRHLYFEQNFKESNLNWA
jgi:hypothetical protein